MTPPRESIVLDPLEIRLEASGILRYLGYPAEASPDSRVAKRVFQAIESARSVQHPRGTYTLYDVVSSDRHSLTLTGGATFTGSIGEFLGNADRAAVFLATAGPEVVQMAEDAARQGDTLGGMVFHALGSELAEAAVTSILSELGGRIRPGQALTMRYSPGYCGISLSQQRTIFELVDAAAIGVELLPTWIMKPVKSVSGLIGMGPSDSVVAYGNPCDRCPLSDCRMRR